MMIKTYTSRTAVVFFVFCFLYAAMFVNVFFIQIIRHRFYMQLGQQQYQVVISVDPARAAIYDRSQQHLLAMTNESIAAFILPHQIEHPQKLATFLKTHFPAAYQRWMSHKNSYFLYVKRRLTAQQLQLIEQQNITDIKLLKEPSRYYPLPSAAAVVGVTDIDNNGLFGLELSYNTQLKGAPAIAILEKDARSGHFYFQKDEIAGTQGQPIVTTLDYNLQFLAAQELQATMKTHQAKEGAVIIMDPSNGDIVSAVTLPSFDPLNTETLDVQMTKNRLPADAYELGSVFKVFTALERIARRSGCL